MELNGRNTSGNSETTKSTQEKPQAKLEAFTMFLRSNVNSRDAWYHNERYSFVDNGLCFIPSTSKVSIFQSGTSVAYLGQTNPSSGVIKLDVPHKVRSTVHNILQ